MKDEKKRSPSAEILAFPNLANSEDVELALWVTALLTAWRANYSKLLDEIAFPNMPGEIDRKTAKHYRGLLDSRNGHAFLDIMWKEDRTDAELKGLGLTRTFVDGCVTAYGLAVQLVEHPRQVAKINSRIRAISIAASACKLIKRDTQLPCRQADHGCRYHWAKRFRNRVPH